MSLGYLTPDARLRPLDDDGLVQPGSLLHTYVSGSPSTPLAAYTDAALTIAHANPIVADAGGLFPAIYLTPGTAYKFVLTDALGNALWDQDPVTVPASATLAAGTGITLSTVGGVTTIAVSGSVAASIGVNDFRLTLESGVPVSATDQLAKTTVYCTPGGQGNQIDLYDAAGVPTRYTAAQFSIALPAAASQLYDVFAYANAGAPALELLAWTNDTTRATALTLATTGVWTKTGDLTRRYVGSVRTTTAAGQSEDSLVKRYLWNACNRVRRPMTRQESATSWTYSSTTVRQANANALNQLDLVVGLPEVAIEVLLQVKANNSAGGGANVAATIGEDSTTASVSSPFTYGTSVSAGIDLPLTAHLAKVPAIGRHFYTWLEQSAASGTTTWGNAGGAVGAGLSLWMEG